MDWTQLAAGGDSSGVQQELVKVVKIYSTSSAFVALRKDGTVRTWGSSFGTPHSKLAPCLKHAVPGWPSQCLCCAVLHCTPSWLILMNKTGSAGGGNSSSVQQDLVDVVEIYSTSGAFAAVRKDGSVRTWGNERGMSCVGLAPYSNACHLRPVVCAAAFRLSWCISVTGTGLAAGGDSSNVQQELVNVVKIYSTSSAFAALRKDGTVRTWGRSGGDSSSVQPDLVNVVKIFSTRAAFAALRKDGTVRTWGIGGRSWGSTPCSELGFFTACAA